MSSNEITAQISSEENGLRVDNLFPYLEKYFSDRAKAVFKNVRAVMSDEMFIYGRIVSEDSDTVYNDFAHRLNKLIYTFDGYNEYDYQGYKLVPIIVSTLAPPLRMPLAPLGKRRCKICNIEVSGLMCTGLGADRHAPCGKFEIENPIHRTMYLAYVFVEGLDIDLFHGSWDEARLWLNTITKDFILASREGQLPTNSAEIINVADLSKA